MYSYYNANPYKIRVGDCVIRAISTALSQSWEKTYADLCVQGLMLFDLPSSNAVWGSYLSYKGYTRKTIPNSCNCYTVENFCKDNPKGTYILGTGTHALTVVDGCYHDVWDSGQELPIYYFEKEK